ncbi:MAG: cupin domain-containing protein [Dehalococcoidia bacterium]
MPSYLINANDVEYSPGGPPEEGWIDMKVQFLINQERAGAEHIVFGRTVFGPGARHEWHRHANAEEFQFLLEGEGVALHDGEEVPVKKSDLWFTPANEWHGFSNTSDKDVVMVWGWAGAGSREAAGYEARP